MSYDTGGTSYHVLAVRVSYLACISRALHIVSHVRDRCVLCCGAAMGVMLSHGYIVRLYVCRGSHVYYVQSSYNARGLESYLVHV